MTRNTLRWAVPLPVIVLAILAALSAGAITAVALADDAHYHVTCVAHGFVDGSGDNDGDFHARIETGFSTAPKTCGLYTNGNFDGDETVTGNVTCDAWSERFGSYQECASTAHTAFSGVFSDHVHKAVNWCG